MGFRVGDICQSMEELAPLEYALDWDNVGLQVGRLNQSVSSVLVTLSITPDVLEKALEQDVDLIVAHHPLIFRPIKHILTDQPLGNMLASIIQANLSVYVAHTNLDRAPQGLNHWLARDLQLQDPKVLLPGSEPGIGLGRVGSIEPRRLGQLAQDLERLWNLPVRIVGESDQIVSICAISGGSGGDFVQRAREVGAEVLITGDVSYHDALDAKACGLAILDAGHFATEKVMVSEVAKYLRERFGNRLVVLEEPGKDPFMV